MCFGGGGGGRGGLTQLKTRAKKNKEKIVNMIMRKAKIGIFSNKFLAQLQFGEEGGGLTQLKTRAKKIRKKWLT